MTSKNAPVRAHVAVSPSSRLSLKHVPDADIESVVIDRARLVLHIDLDNNLLVRPVVEADIGLFLLAVRGIARLVVPFVVTREHTEFWRNLERRLDVPTSLLIAPDGFRRRAVEIPLGVERAQSERTAGENGMRFGEPRAHAVREGALGNVLLILQRRGELDARHSGPLQARGISRIVRARVRHFLPAITNQE